MNYQESLDYLYGLQLFGIKLGLDNMRALQDRLPELQQQPTCIHVAGTNGKGSVCVMLAEIFQQAGYKVGLYTSPHLHDFGERIRINGKAATSEEIVVLTEAVRAVSSGLSITFFEATTAMALLAFHRHKVDIAIIETGLGGRLDATNIVKPKLSLITPVSYDHSEHLGECLKEIAAEKAGIIKARTPVIVGKQVPEVAAVIRQVALSQNAEIMIAGDDYNWAGSLQRFHVDMKSSKIENLRCNLAGAHQADNFAQAIVAALKMRSLGFAVNDHHIRAAGQNLSWPGRLEWWGEHNELLVDVAHNRAGIECLAEYLCAQNITRVHLVVGLSGERNPETVLKPLVKFVASVYAVPVSYNQAVSPEELCRWAKSKGIASRHFTSAEEGLTVALSTASSSTPVVVCGSLYLVAELRGKFLEGGAAPQYCRG